MKKLALFVTLLSFMPVWARDDRPAFDLHGPVRHASTSISNDAVLDILESYPAVEFDTDGGLVSIDSKKVGECITNACTDKSGKYLARFEMPDGAVTGVKIKKSVSYDLDKEAVGVLRGLPQMEPATSGGRYADSTMDVSVNFRL